MRLKAVFRYGCSIMLGSPYQNKHNVIQVKITSKHKRKLSHLVPCPPYLTDSYFVTILDSVMCLMLSTFAPIFYLLFHKPDTVTPTSISTPLLQLP